MKIAATTKRPARRSAAGDPRANAMPSGTAVRASPKLWMRSARRAMLPVRAKIAVWATAAVPRTASESRTARMPSRDRLTLSSMSPWECPGSCVLPPVALLAQDELLRQGGARRGRGIGRHRHGLGHAAGDFDVAVAPRHDHLVVIAR